MIKSIGMPVMVFLWSGTVFAAHPLITDDAGTQGKGKLQLEVNGEYTRESEDGAAGTASGAAAILSYGLADDRDIVLGVPYQHIRTNDSGTATVEGGVSDASLELKWRFYQENGLAVALKPGITLPTGDDEKGMGAGKVTYSLFFIAARELNPWAFSLNLGYRRKENTADERVGVWHASLASQVEVFKNLKAVANIGIESSPDRTSSAPPAFVLGGAIYALSENVDVDFGVKSGLHTSAVDYAILAGTTLRF